MKIIKILKIVSAAFGLLILVSIQGHFDENPGAFIFGLLIGVVLIYLGVRKKKDAAETQENPVNAAETQQNTENNVQTQQPPIEVKETPTTSQMHKDSPRNDSQVLTIPSKFMQMPLAYNYDNVSIFTPDDIAVAIDFPALPLGATLSLRQEPENPYDSGAIAVYLEDQKIGYLYRNKLQEMANDFIKSHCPIFAAIQAVNDDEHKIEIALAYYRPKLHTGKTKSFKLTGNRNQEMQEAILFANEGDEIFVDYDFEKDKYSAGDLGYFPKSAEKYLEDDPFVVISSIKLDENDKYVVTVEVEIDED